MNRTAVFITFSMLAGVGIVGALVLSIHRPDATATFIGLVVTILGLVATFAGTAYGLGRLGEKVEAVRKQTNGTLSARDEEIARLREENRELHVQLARRSRPFWRRLMRA